MNSINTSFFFSLKNELTEVKEKKATWEEVALHCKKMNFDIFNNKNSKAVRRRIADFEKKGIPSKVKLQYLESDFKPSN